MDRIEVEGLRIAFRRAGEGPPLLLLHGGLQDGRVWRRQIDDLSSEFTVVAWDAPGCGRSSDPPETFTWLDYTVCLASFIEALGFRRLHVAGTFLGAALALELYRHHPGVPTSLVLAPPYAGFGSLPPEVAEQRVQQVLAEADLPPDRWIPRYLSALLSEAAPADVVEDLAEILSEAHPAGMRVMARAFADVDIRDVLPRIDAPTLLLEGGADQPAFLKMAEEFDAAIPRSRLVVLPGIGPQANMEAAASFNAEVRRFLTSA